MPNVSNSVKEHVKVLHMNQIQSIIPHLYFLPSLNYHVAIFLCAHAILHSEPPPR